MDTVAATVLRLALLDDDCLKAHNLGSGNKLYHLDGEICKGKVARFPMLREPCEGCGGHGKIRRSDLMGSQPCPMGCLSRGWVPVSGPAAVVALLEAGRPWHIGIWDRGKGWQSGHLIPGMSNHTLTKECSTMEEALVAALEAATG